MNRVIYGDNFLAMEELGAGEPQSFDLVYLDPPFNTGEDQKIHGNLYSDYQAEYSNWLGLRLHQIRWLLKKTGSVFVHLDYREVHYIKIEMDKIFWRSNFRNEIIWAYDYGGRPKTVWPKKHDTILWYTKSDDYTYNLEASDRIEYMAPKLVGAEKAAAGKTPTDVWWHTIVHTTGAERVDYPTQKPLGILERIVKVHSNPGDKLLDCFAGSGTFGEAAAKHGRQFTLIDNNPQAIEVMSKRLARYEPAYLCSPGTSLCNQTDPSVA